MDFESIQREATRLEEAMIQMKIIINNPPDPTNTRLMNSWRQTVVMICNQLWPEAVKKYSEIMLGDYYTVPF
jgi:hypothetical protein